MNVGAGGTFGCVGETNLSRFPAPTKSREVAVTRAARQVAKEIADALEHRGAGHPVGRAVLLPADYLQRWLLLLAPPKRKVRPRDPARSARRATVKELDALCREVVFLRDGGKCRRCGKEAVDWSHVYSRRYKWLRWDLDNSSASCKGCHLAWHHRPLEGAAWWAKELGPKRYQALVLRAARPRKTEPLLIKAYLEAERRKL